MLNKSNSQIENPQHCDRLNCLCKSCQKQAQLIRMIDHKSSLQWFGKKKPYHFPPSHSSIIKEDPISREQNIKRQNQMKCKKNESSSEAITKKYISINSNYLQNFDKKSRQKTNLCSPQHELSLKKPIQQIRSVYFDCYKRFPYYQSEKSMKPRQTQFNLPFFGKSSYKSDYLNIKTDRTNTIIPKDNLIDRNIIQNYSQIKTIDHRNKRPVSPIIHKDSQIQSKPLRTNYDTNYRMEYERNNTEEEANQIKKNKKQQDKHHQYFLRKSKFGSLSKNRWIKQKVRSDVLDMYL